VRGERIEPRHSGAAAELTLAPAVPKFRRHWNRLPSGRLAGAPAGPLGWRHSMTTSPTVSPGLINAARESPGRPDPQTWFRMPRSVASSPITELNERSREIFRLIVDGYVATGEPIGSRTLSRRLAQNLSPATIRNVMADLEEAGLLYAPHTSAGRLPTELGLRLFVHGLLEIGGLAEDERLSIETLCVARGKSLPQVLEEATSALSGLSHCAGIVVVPNQDRPLKHIEFVHLGPGRALVVRGQANLLEDVTALADLERLRTLFEMLETRETMLRLLDASKQGEGVQIFIGAENRLFGVAGCSMVIAPYQNSREHIVGAIGVIGPTRINYARIIPMVDYTAKVIGRLIG